MKSHAITKISKDKAKLKIPAFFRKILPMQNFMIPCMQRIRKRVQGKNEQTQRCDCLLRCAPECGISILTCGQSLERFLPAFFNKRGKSGCWIPSQASTARSMEWSGGQEGLQGSGAGCWRSCIERRLCGRDIAPMWSAFESYQKEEEAQEAAEVQLDKAANE